MATNWPPVLSLDTPLPVHLCPEVGQGLLVIPAAAAESDFTQTKEVLDAIEWEITDTIAGVNVDGADVVELKAPPTGLLTLEAAAGAQEQLSEKAGL